MATGYCQGKDAKSRSFDLIEFPDPKLKWCPRCRQWLPEDMFSGDITQADGKNCRCRECDGQYCRVKKARRTLKKVKEEIEKVKQSGRR